VAADGAAWRPEWRRKKDRRAAAARGRVRVAQGRAGAAAGAGDRLSESDTFSRPDSAGSAVSIACTQPEKSVRAEAIAAGKSVGTAVLPRGDSSETHPSAPSSAPICGCGPTLRAQAVAAADLAGEPVETTARALGVSSRTVETYRAKPQHQGLMLELAERHRATLEDGYARAVISALADLEAGEWQARDRARAWLTEQVQRSDVARGLVAQAGGLAPALGGDKPTLTEVVMVLRQFQGPGAG